jgi:hypothetical protein
LELLEEGKSSTGLADDLALDRTSFLTPDGLDQFLLKRYENRTDSTIPAVPKTPQKQQSQVIVSRPSGGFTSTIWAMRDLLTTAL